MTFLKKSSYLDGLSDGFESTDDLCALPALLRVVWVVCAILEHCLV